ncbi:type I-B CRISPR-associated protein Cas8b1/Cst1 [Geobacillus subterraneus]|uniref:type I-B CRISPR-associated protein Cas8b1/Cst1 n=1 Tax=Geobacillus subterraneus TaxID=129338 RepID=UPI002AC96079|nr:type I-B CRISPR-associated protein Cas8b1/Cst1 [Geobacillus subterraneus]WPZ19207.1 type I-B CRISPR-associated protein Cas8b1/Cst1 [Geobacillus subterraneus]
MIEYTKNKLTSNSYKNTYHLMAEHGEALQQIALSLKKVQKKNSEGMDKVMKELSEAIACLQQAVDHLRSPFARKYILARNIIYDLISHYWEGVSFLHKGANKSNMYETYHHYFINPVLRYVEEMQSERYKRYKYQCFTCGNKISSLSSAYELTWIHKTGVDSARKSSHFWNYQSDAYICPICNFVYSCVPAGFTFLQGKGIFINENLSVRKLCDINKMAIENVERFEELEQKSYYYILDSLGQASLDKAEKEIQNIQVVKMDTLGGSTRYTFNILSRERLRIISKNRDRLKSLIGMYIKEDKYYINLHEEVIKRLYENRNQYDLIDKLFRMLVNGKFNSIATIRHILYINHEFMSEGRRGAMLSYKKIKKFQQAGLDLRQKYGDQLNKIPGITYRLLNALKVKNKDMFMQTFINAYTYKNEPIPLDFIEVLQDDQKFQTIGYAFLLGLQGDSGELMEEANRDE